MKKITALSSLLLFAAVFASCEQEVDYGYPSTVRMPSEGGRTVLRGDSEYAGVIRQIEILNYDGDGNGSYGEACDSIAVTAHWLTVKCPRTKNELHLTGEPNKTHKSRRLYLYLYDGRSRQEIKVIQD
ncbi:MAG: hypothetical protein K2J51_06510 [Alistipes sp.]|nr:hypothetical protein [Alistipes sp.]